MLFHRDIRRWSPADDAMLSINYPNGLVACQAAFPNRSVIAIIGRAKRLGLSRAARGPKRPWTGVEETKLRRLWVSAQRATIQTEIPGRSWPAIVTKASKMGLATRSFVARHSPKTSDNPIIQEIANRMRAQGFTMADLDDVSGIGPNVSGRWFANQSRPSLYNVERAVTALGGRLVVIWEPSC